MASYITLDTLMDNLNTDLNALGVELEGTGKINRAIPFNIVANSQDYEDVKTFSDTAKVPGIGLNLSSTISPSQVYQSYRQVVAVTLNGFTQEIDDIEYLLNEFLSRNTGKFFKSEDWVYQLILELPTFIRTGVDEGEERFSAIFNITYSFLFKGFTSDDILLKINGEEIPVITYTHTMTKDGTTIPSLNNPDENRTKNKVTTVTKVIKFAHINNTELMKVFEDIDTGDFMNQTYTVFYGLGCDESGLNCTYDNTETMVLTNGTIQYTEGGFQVIEGTFLIYNNV